MLSLCPENSRNLAFRTDASSNVMHASHQNSHMISSLSDFSSLIELHHDADGGVCVRSLAKNGVTACRLKPRSYKIRDCKNHFCFRPSPQIRFPLTTRLCSKRPAARVSLQLAACGAASTRRGEPRAAPTDVVYGPFCKLSARSQCTQPTSGVSNMEATEIHKSTAHQCWRLARQGTSDESASRSLRRGRLPSTLLVPATEKPSRLVAKARAAAMDKMANQRSARAEVHAAREEAGTARSQHQAKGPKIILSGLSWFFCRVCPGFFFRPSRADLVQALNLQDDGVHGFKIKDLGPITIWGLEQRTWDLKIKDLDLKLRT